MVTCVGRHRDGTLKFAQLCYGCRRRKYNLPTCGDGGQYSLCRAKTCIKCGFVPEDICQLDVDHIDGNHQNNDPTNLQTLCANCHRLKTKRERSKLQVLENS